MASRSHLAAPARSFGTADPPEQYGIKLIWPVRRADYNDAALSGNAVDLCQQLIHVAMSGVLVPSGDAHQTGPQRLWKTKNERGVTARLSAGGGQRSPSV